MLSAQVSLNDRLSQHSTRHPADLQGSTVAQSPDVASFAQYTTESAGGKALYIGGLDEHPPFGESIGLPTTIQALHVTYVYSVQNPMNGDCEAIDRTHYVPIQEQLR